MQAESHQAVVLLYINIIRGSPANADEVVGMHNKRQTGR